MTEGKGANGQAVELVTIGGRVVEADTEIATLVRILNANGFATKASCSGHGYRPATIALASGHWIVIADRDEWRKIEALFPTDINGNTRTPTATPSDEGWQPIETAPKDGTAVWLAVDSQSFIGYFDPARAYSDGDEGEWVVKASFRRVQNGCDEIAGRYWRKAVPTHWMPLPEPPSAIEGEKK